MQRLFDGRFGIGWQLVPSNDQTQAGTVGLSIDLYLNVGSAQFRQGLGEDAHDLVLGDDRPAQLDRRLYPSLELQHRQGTAAGAIHPIAQNSPTIANPIAQQRHVIGQQRRQQKVTAFTFGHGLQGQWIHHLDQHCVRMQMIKAVLKVRALIPDGAGLRRAVAQ